MSDGTRPRRADSLVAEANFRRRLEELGATLLETEWLGALNPHRAVDAAGHHVRPRPASVAKGEGICVICAGKDPRAAESEFRARLVGFGAELLEPYHGRNSPHRVRCSAGHDCSPRPGDLRRGRGPCRRCTGLDSAPAKAAFIARMAEMGAVVLGEYRNARTKVHAICPAGHECYPTPHAVQKGRGICKPCGGSDSAAAEAKFQARLRDLGATAAYEKWGGVEQPLRCICAAGHTCYPKPHQVNSGDGICSRCANWDHTVFYVVEHQSSPVVKFGITSGGGRRRLTSHERDGFTVPHLLVTGLPQGLARETENAVKSALTLAGEKPVRGLEYFDASCLALILDVANSWVQSVAG